MHLPNVAAGAAAALLALSAPSARAADLDIRFAGALEFSDQGTLFVGDNYNGAIYAFEIPAEAAPATVAPISIGDIDTRIANMLGVGPKALEINDLAVHPVSHDIYISVSRIGSFASQPAIVRVSQRGEIDLLDLSSFSFAKQALDAYPDQQTTFRPRGLMGEPPTARDMAKGQVALSSLAIMDLLYHDGELFVSGVAHDDFLSTLRRISYPFDGAQSMTTVEMYHIAHDQYETRAPIRAMTVAEIDGREQLIAAYTCSPVVLIPLEDIVDGAKISAHTIGDMGNGQPIDMIPYALGDQPGAVRDQQQPLSAGHSARRPERREACHRRGLRPRDEARHPSGHAFRPGGQGRHVRRRVASHGPSERRPFRLDHARRPFRQPEPRLQSDRVPQPGPQPCRGVRLSAVRARRGGVTP